MNSALYILLTAAGCLLLFIIVSWLVGIYMARLFAFPPKKPLKYTYAKCLENGEFTKEIFHSYQFQDFSVESDYGYTLRGVYSLAACEGATTPVLPDAAVQKIAVFCHGHVMTWHSMVKYFEPYAQRGYALIAYDHRFHGNSGGSCCSAGFYEKLDLKLVADWAFTQFPNAEVFGVIGESMGAATVLQYMPQDSRLTFVHADCPYSDARDLYAHQMQFHHLPKFMHRTTMAFCNRQFSRKCGFTLDQVSPIRDASESDIPLFLAHGKEDTYVPTRMSVEIAGKRKRDSKTKLLLIDEASHAKDVLVAPELYHREAGAFLDEVENG